MSDHLDMTESAELEAAWDAVNCAATRLRDDCEEGDLSWRHSLSLEQLDSDIYEDLKEMAKQSEAVDSDWVEGLSASVFLRDAVRLIGEEGVRDVYPLPPGEPEPIVYRDGSRSDQVVMDEVEDMLDRYGMETDRVLLEVLDWSDAARAAFRERFRERWPYS